MGIFVDSPENIQNFRLKEKRFTGISEDSGEICHGMYIYQGNKDFTDWKMKRGGFYF